jgi:hypothetical protein
MSKILTKPKDDKWIAYKHDDPRIWGMGDTEKEAIGDLLCLHGQYFTIQVSRE